MTDLKRRFEEIDQLPVSRDLRGRIERLVAEPITPRPRAKRLGAVVVAFLAVIALGGVTYLAFGGRLDRGVSVSPSTSGSPEVTSTTFIEERGLVDVPDVRGMTAEEAGTVLRSAGLAVAIGGDVPVPEDSAELSGPLSGLELDRLPGLVARQNPGADDMAESGSVIEILVFAGPSGAEGVSPSSCPMPQALPLGVPQWMIDIHGFAEALAVETNRLAEALYSIDDFSAGWQSRSPVDSVLGAIEADLRGIVGVVEELGWIEIETGYWEPLGDYPTPDDPLYWLDEMLGGVSNYQSAILPEWYALTGREAVVSYLTQGGQRGTPCAGAASIVMMVDHMAKFAG